MFIACRFLWLLDNISRVHIKPTMYDGVVVLTNVLYIFLLFLRLTLGQEDCGVLQGKGGGVCGEMLEHVFASFQKKGQFYQGLSSK